MKKISTVLLAFVTAMCFVACSESPDDFSKSTAKKLFKKEYARLHKLEGASTITTGYYECNDGEARYKLRQLAANEIITYSCDVVKKMVRVKKTRRVQTGYYYRYWTTESYWVNEDIDTYFVKVALTEKGSKLVAEEEEIEPDEDTKDLNEDKELDLSKYPESSVEILEFPEPEVEEVLDDVAEEQYDEAESDETAEPVAQAEPTKEKSAYEKAKEKENTEDVILKAYELDVIKARNVRRTGDYTGQAEILLEYDNVTPVGRIMLGVYNGQRLVTSTMRYVFFEDKGWRLDND